MKLLYLAPLLLAGCQTSQYAQSRIDEIRAEQAQQYTIQENLERRLDDLESGAEPAYPGEVDALEERIDDIEGEIKGRDDLVGRIKAEDAGSQTAMWQNLLIGIASLFGAGGLAKSTLGRSRSSDAVGQLQVDVAKAGHQTEVLVDEIHKKVDEGQELINQKINQLASIIGAFQQGMNQVPPPPTVPSGPPSTPTP